MEKRSKAIDWKKDSSGLMEKRWYSYALAGAGVLATAPAAHATITSNGITSSGPLSVNSTATCAVSSSCNSVIQFGTPIVLNLSGLTPTPFGNFNLTAGVSSSVAYLYFNRTNPGGNSAGALLSGGLNTPRFTFGQSIGPGGGFTNPTNSHVLNPFGVWDNGDGYLGLEFVVTPMSGPVQDYFGWAEINTVTNFTPGGMGPFCGANCTYSVTLEGWAFEDTAGMGIDAGDTGITPEPGTAGLLLLGMGAVGLAAWRKRKQAQKAA